MQRWRWLLATGRPCFTGPSAAPAAEVGRSASERDDSWRRPSRCPRRAHPRVRARRLIPSRTPGCTADAATHRGRTSPPARRWRPTRSRSPASLSGRHQGRRSVTPSVLVRTARSARPCTIVHDGAVGGSSLCILHPPATRSTPRTSSAPHRSSSATSTSTGATRSSSRRRSPEASSGRCARVGTPTRTRSSPNPVFCSVATQRPTPRARGR